MKRITPLLIVPCILAIACDAPDTSPSGEAAEAQTDLDLDPAEDLIDPEAPEPEDEGVADESRVPQAGPDALASTPDPLARRGSECLEDNQCPTGERCERFSVGSGLVGGTCVGPCSDWTDCDFAEECGGDGFCSLLFNGDWDYCRQGDCERGEGDCDANADCQGSLTCMQNNGSAWGMASGKDVCDFPAGHNNYCSAEFPCEENQGDCDSGNECNFGLKCVNNIGANFGFANWVDICKPWWWF